MVSFGAVFFPSGTCVTANQGLTILVENAMVIFLVISVPLTGRCVFAHIDAVL